jgi:hypothetical protein
MTVRKDRTQRAQIDNVNPNTMADNLRKIALGSFLQGQVPQVRRRVNQDANGVCAYNVATLDVLQLPDGGKACSIVRATVRAGGVTGELTAAAFGATPTTGQIAVAPNGNIVTLAADAITNMDVVYLPERGDVIESVFPVASDAITLPASLTSRGVVLLLEAESVEGTLVGKLIVLTPSASAAATGQARLDLAKATVKFATADAVTRARVKLLVLAAEDLCTVLESEASTL